ncbi:MAG: uL15m family ribosomal protein [Candidatus Woesearchaeota archaeon]
MTINRRKKVRKYRGSKTHGGGAMKKRRGAGHRGGRGNAGSGKRADQKKPSFLKEYGGSYFGRHGFKRPYAYKPKAISIGQIDSLADKLVKKGLAMLDKETYTINLGKAGYDRLIGTGKVTKKLRIKVDHASNRAIERIKLAGGEVELPQLSEELVEEKQEK